MSQIQKKKRGQVQGSLARQLAQSSSCRRFSGATQVSQGPSVEQAYSRHMVGLWIRERASTSAWNCLTY